RDMAVGGAELVGAPVVVEGELELFLLAGHAEEVVRRLELAVPDDRELATELHAERLVEGTAPVRIGDPDHRVQIARCHAGILLAGPGAQSRSSRRREKSTASCHSPCLR